METLWFCLVAVMIADVRGAGRLRPWRGCHSLPVSRAPTPSAARCCAPSVRSGTAMKSGCWPAAALSISPFPRLYASGFSGFYLPLMMVLWLLILRGISIEFRNHIESPVWNPFWDFVFCRRQRAARDLFRRGPRQRGSRRSARSKRLFFLPLWTNFGLGLDTGILDWYTVLVGVTALLALAMHGSLWVQFKTFAPVRERAARVAAWTWWGVLLFTALLTMVTFSIQPQVVANFKTWPVGFILPALAVAGLAGVQFELRRGKELHAFLGSCTYLLGMLTSVVFGVYPMVLPSRDPAYSLTVTNAKAGAYGLKIGLIWWGIGMLLATGYFIYVYRTFSGKVAAEAAPHPDLTNDY